MKNRGTILFVCLMLGTLALGAVSPGSAETPEKIKLGLMFGLTGPASPIGPVQMKGAEMAINEINAAGGVKLGARRFRSKRWSGMTRPRATWPCVVSKSCATRSRWRVWSARPSPLSPRP